jgi:two-component system phosphate regulon sensor histidine kinase PhoR
MRTTLPVEVAKAAPPARQAWRFSTWLVAVASVTLLGLLAFMLGLAAVGSAGGLPLVSGLGLAVAGLILVIAVYIDRRIIDPIERLTQAVHRVVEGDLGETIYVDGMAEVNVLADAFNELGARLRAVTDTLTVERRRVAVAFAAMADGMVVVDRQMRVQRVNDAACRLLRVASEGAVGQTVAAVVRDHELFGVLHSTMTERRTCTADVRLATPSGGRLGDVREEPRYIRATGFAIPGAEHADDPAGVLMLHDVTELRRSEAIRREFVANVSHELRTPLASLKALAETLEEGALDDPPAAREFLAQMHVEVDSLAQMVQELLDLSKIESGQAILRPQSVPPDGLAAEAEARLRMQADRVDVRVILDAPPGLPNVLADPARVVQVLINLLHNAIKFTPPGGEVTLALAREGEAVRFMVADTGIGISPLDLPRIFERFYKVDKSRASGGTGLGLAIAKHIVQAHGGRIWAESDGEGQGATFAFTLPVTAPSGGILPGTTAASR